MVRLDFKVVRLEDEDELRVVFADLELVDWCRTITSHAGELLASLGITVTFQTELVQLPTLGDRGLLEQLLYALLSNAAKAMDGGGRLSVALGRRGDNAVLTVGDEGRGMSEETLVRLFQDGDGPNLLPGAGAGFGLRLARTIAELHGGLMILENDPGHAPPFSRCSRSPVPCRGSGPPPPVSTSHQRCSRPAWAGRAER